MVLPYRDRREAGKVLAGELGAYANRPDVLVLALPRGGVPVGYEVAKALGAPLDVFVVRKLGLPGHEDLAMGAVASGGVRVLNDEVIRMLNVPERAIDEVAEREKRTLEERERAYRDGLPAARVEGKTVILVDDGLATGSTMRAAIAAVKQQRPARIVVAVPIAAPSACDELGVGVDDIICAETREPFYAVGFWYRDFPQTTDKQVRDLLREAARSRSTPSDRAA